MAACVPGSDPVGVKQLRPFECGPGCNPEKVVGVRCNESEYPAQLRLRCSQEKNAEGWRGELALVRTRCGKRNVSVDFFLEGLGVVGAVRLKEKSEEGIKPH